MAVAKSFSVSSLVQHIKVLFIMFFVIYQGVDIFFNLIFFHELVNIFIVIVYITV